MTESFSTPPGAFRRFLIGSVTAKVLHDVPCPVPDLTLGRSRPAWIGRLVSLQLDLLSGGSVIPYLAFERSSGSGNGVTTFVSNANEYALPNRLRDANDTWRAGVRLGFARFHASGGIGRTAFRDDQQVFDATGINTGNREVPYLGQTLFLTRVQQSYGVRGQGVLTKDCLPRIRYGGWMSPTQLRISVPA